MLAGGDELGRWMTEHAGIDKIGFTGSVATGKAVMVSAATNLKRVTLELGGNDAAIVLDDVDAKAIAPKLFFAAFVNKRSGVNGHQAHLRARACLRRAVRCACRRGTSSQRWQWSGSCHADRAIQTRKQYDRVLGILEDAKQSGARILGGGDIPTARLLHPATIVADIDANSRLVREEQFGPIVPILKFTDVEDALRRAMTPIRPQWLSVEPRSGARSRHRVAPRGWNSLGHHHRATSATVPFAAQRNQVWAGVFRDGDEGVSRAARDQRSQAANVGGVGA